MMVTPVLTASGKPEDLRRRVLAEARSWIGTPYQHQASCKGVGCDCLGLLRGLVRHIYGQEPESIPAYAADWSLAGSEDLLAAGRRWLIEVPSDKVRPGDVLLFRWQGGVPARHVGVLSAPDQFIHAYERVGVTESPLVPAWSKRLAYCFQFPETLSWQP